MKRILVVDDEPVVRALVEASLADAYDVTSVADGPGALRAIGARRPDLILLYVGLPGMSGRDVLRRLRAAPAGAGVPVLYLTGLEPAEDAGVQGVIRKPFTPASLRTAVAGCLAVPSHRP